MSMVEKLRTLREDRPGQTGYWLIFTRDGAGPPVALSSEDGRTLYIFSFEEEAELFLGTQSWTLDGGWIQWASPVELLGVLRELLDTLTRVALDPIPESICTEAWELLFIVGRREFMNQLEASFEVSPESGREAGSRPENRTRRERDEREAG